MKLFFHPLSFFQHKWFKKIISDSRCRYFLQTFYIYLASLRLLMNNCCFRYTEFDFSLFSDYVNASTRCFWPSKKNGEKNVGMKNDFYLQIRLHLDEKTMLHQVISIGISLLIQFIQSLTQFTISKVFYLHWFTHESWRMQILLECKYFLSNMDKKHYQLADSLIRSFFQCLWIFHQ